MTLRDSLRRATARPRTTSAEPHEAPDGADHRDRGARSAPGDDRRRTVRIAALATVLVVLAGGSVATARAHKSVTLDVDGRSVEVSTFAGSVGGLLAAHDVELNGRDIVAPGVEAGLRDGDEVVVRHARQLAVLTDGEETHIWTTALSADEALSDLAVRGDDVRLVASRSLSTGRADLPVDLAGPVDVVADGDTLHVADGAAGLDAVLESLDITVGELDRVHVGLADAAQDADGASTSRAPVTVVVQRVVAEERTTLTDIPFEETVAKTDDLYKGQSRTAVAGIVGERTTVHRLILVDGVEESSVVLSDAVTRQPVTQVIQQGTKARPVARSSGGGSGGGSVSGDVWAALAQCESGGNPSIVSASGKYHGLYQFSVGTWKSVGGSGLPSDASAQEQTERAQALQARSGWGQWPACSSKLGLR